MVPGIVPLLDGMFGSMGGYLGPWMRTLTLWVERGRGCPCSTCRVQLRMKGLVRPPVGPR